MNIVIKRFDCYCSLEEFTINDQQADSDDFGDLQDLSPSTAPIYGCGNRQFVPYSNVTFILKAMDKYSITADQYNDICEELKEALYIGQCGLCA